MRYQYYAKFLCFFQAFVEIHTYLYVMNCITIYPLMMVKIVKMILRDYIPTIPIVGNYYIIVTSMIASILIWNFEIIVEIDRESGWKYVI